MVAVMARARRAWADLVAVATLQAGVACWYRCEQDAASGLSVLDCHAVLARADRPASER